MRFLSRLTALSVFLFCWMPLSAQGPRQHFSFSTTFQAVLGGIFLRTVPPVQAGIVHLNSVVQLSGADVDLDLIARLEYTNGNGPFSGFITFRWTNGDVLVTRYVGDTVVIADGSSTVTGSLEVFGGDGLYTNASGHGTVHGRRSGVFGTPVIYDVNLDVKLTGGSGAAALAGGVNLAPAGGRSANGIGLGVKQDFSLTTLLSSDPDEQVLNNTGAGGRFRYGIVRLTGASFASGAPVSVEVAVAVEYASGDGAYSGFMNFDFVDGSVFCRYQGRTTQDKDGNSTVRGALDVYFGTGAYASARGVGRVEGSRSGVVGSSLTNTIQLQLQ